MENRTDWLDFSEFMTKDNTIFTKGPFIIEGKTYDYKILDPSDGLEDYASVQQLLYWINDGNPVIGIID